MLLFAGSSGAAAAGIIFFVTYMPYFIINDSVGDMSVGALVACSLLNNIAMALGCVQISKYEGTGMS